MFLQRHSIGPIDDLIGDLLGQGLAAGDVRDHLGELAGWQSKKSFTPKKGVRDDGRRRPAISSWARALAQLNLENEEPV
jgi:hypothetical protein